MEGFDYDAAAATVAIEDITRDATNREILRRLKENDPEFHMLWVVNSFEGSNNRANHMFWPEDAHIFGWLGYYAGRNTHLRELYLSDPISKIAIEPFCRGLNRNRSIQKIEFYMIRPFGGEIFQSLSPFFENNNSISELVVVRCAFGAGCARRLAGAESLQRISKVC